MAEGVDMGADVQRQHDRVLGELEAAGPLRAGRVVAAIPPHEVHDPRPVARHRQPVRDLLA